MAEITLHFHQIRQGQTLDYIAQRYKVSEVSIRNENPDVKFEAGDIVIINLKHQMAKAA